MQGNPKPPPLEPFYLFNLTADRHELCDIKRAQPVAFKRMRGLYDRMLLSILHSAEKETGCARLAVQLDQGVMEGSNRSSCEWEEDTGLNGGDLLRSVVTAGRDECARACAEWPESDGRVCAAADWNGGRCFLKGAFRPFRREGGQACRVMTPP